LRVKREHDSLSVGLTLSAEREPKQSVSRCYAERVAQRVLMEPDKLGAWLDFIAERQPKQDASRSYPELLPFSGAVGRKPLCKDELCRKMVVNN